MTECHAIVIIIGITYVIKSFQLENRAFWVKDVLSTCNNRLQIIYFGDFPAY